VKMGVIPSRHELEKGSAKSAAVGMSKGLMVANNDPRLVYDGATGQGKCELNLLCREVYITNDIIVGPILQAPLAPRNPRPRPVALSPFGLGSSEVSHSSGPPLPPMLDGLLSGNAPPLDKILLGTANAEREIGKKNRSELQGGTSSTFRPSMLSLKTIAGKGASQTSAPSPTSNPASTSKEDAQLASSPSAASTSFSWTVPTDGPSFKDVNGKRGKKGGNYGPLGIQQQGRQEKRMQMESVTIPKLNLMGWAKEKPRTLGDFDATAFAVPKKGTMAAAPPEPSFSAGPSTRRSNTRTVSSTDFDDKVGKKLRSGKRAH